uniref:Uncharacterized protein n=1 Tax=Oryzias latipes TaxID=8090 RepID=A0A3P9I3F7_ORYLA
CICKITFPTSRLLALTSSSSCWTFLNLDIMDLFCFFLELLLSTLHSQVLSFIQTVLQVLHCDLHVLLHPLQMSAGVLLKRIKGLERCKTLRKINKITLHGFNHPLAVPLDLFQLLILLCQLPVDLTFDLVELKLYSENLGFLMF